MDHTACLSSYWVFREVTQGIILSIECAFHEACALLAAIQWTCTIHESIKSASSSHFIMHANAPLAEEQRSSGSCRAAPQAHPVARCSPREKFSLMLLFVVSACNAMNGLAHGGEEGVVVRGP